mgnify:CR=1 FL=1
MKVILNQQITDLLADEELENEIEVEDYHLYQSDDPNDICPQEPWAWWYKELDAKENIKWN